jgi:hypothetical protein
MLIPDPEKMLRENFCVLKLDGISGMTFLDNSRSSPASLALKQAFHKCSPTADPIKPTISSFVRESPEHLRNMFPAAGFDKLSSGSTL